MRALITVAVAVSFSLGGVGFASAASATHTTPLVTSMSAYGAAGLGSGVS